MTQRFNPTHLRLASRVILLAAMGGLVTGCGMVPVRHVPKPGAISVTGMPSLRQTPPIDVKAGECSAAETAIGSAGVGKVMGKMSEWTDVTVALVRSNLTARGAVVEAGSPKALTITMTKAEIKSVPIPGGAKSKILLTANTADGRSSVFEGSSYSMAPLGSVDGAVADAVRKLLQDSVIEDYVRQAR